jgi:16S rRNA (guanine527-N7)-methyltransferase
MPPETAGDPARLQAAALALGLSISEQQVERLLQYRSALLRWNRVYNLTALRDPEQVLVQHLLDCLAIIPSLRRYQAAAGADPGSASFRVMDVGSGAGLPGIVMALLQPDWLITCVDAVAKKCAFLRQMAGELALPQLRVEHARVEDLPGPSRGAPGQDLITCRAFSSLADLVRLSQPLLAPAGVWVAMKGQRPDAEIAELPDTIEVFHVEQLQLPGQDLQRHLVWMRPAALRPT